MEKETKTKVPPLPKRPKGSKKVADSWMDRNWPSLLMVGLAVFCVVCLLLFLPKRNGDKPSEPLKPVAVRVMVVEELPEVDDTFRILGTVEPDCTTDVAAEVAGRIEAYAGRADKIINEMKVQPGPASAGVVDEGDKIKAGQPILYINTDLLQAAYDQAKADCDFAERESKRLEELLSKNVATKSEVDSIRRQRDMARANLEIAQANLERSIIVAPTSGELNDMPLDVGEFVSPGIVVAQIVDMDTVKVVLEIPERDISYLKVGQEQDIFFGRDAADGETGKTEDGESRKEFEKVTGRITYISSLADRNTHTTRMEISVDNHHRKLWDGQMVYAQLKRRTLKNVIMVPLKTVVPLEKGYVAYVNNNGKAERRKIKLDRSMFRGESIRVAEGLKAGDRLIIEPNIGPDQAIFEVGENVLPTTSAPSGAAVGRE